MIQPARKRSVRRGGVRGGQILIKAVIAGVVVLGGVGVGAAALRGGESNGSHRSGTADMATVVQTTFDITTTATGELEALNQIELRSELETQSTIVEIVKEGSRVKKGDVIVRLNAEEIQRQIDTQRLEVSEAEASKVAAENEVTNQASTNESEIRKADLKVALAELSLRQWEEGELDKQYTQLKLAIEQAERQFTRLTEKVRNSRELFAQGFLSKDELDLDEISLIEAESKLQTAILDEEIYWTYTYPKDREQKTSDLTEAKAELERVRTTNEIQLTTKTVALENRKQQLNLRQARLTELEKQHASCEIKAPTDGLVVYSTSNEDFFYMGGNQGPLQVGRQVHPNEPLIRLPDTSAIIAKVRVHERLAGQVKTGQFARVKVDALGGAEFEGEIESIGILAETVWRDNRKEYTVRIAIKSGEQLERLKPTGGCEAEIRIGQVEDALAVPVQAVFSDGPVRFVYVPRGAKFERVPIKQGRNSKAFVEVAAGLKVNQRVLLREPSPAEVMGGGWDAAELKLVGLEVNEKGEPVAPANQWGGRGPGGGKPGGDRARAEGEHGKPEGGQGDDKGTEVAQAPADGEQAIAPEGEAKPEETSSTEAKPEGDAAPAAAAPPPATPATPGNG
jgi:HlyD family secretion protein